MFGAAVVAGGVTVVAAGDVVGVVESIVEKMIVEHSVTVAAAIVVVAAVSVVAVAVAATDVVGLQVDVVSWSPESVVVVAECVDKVAVGIVAVVDVVPTHQRMYRKVLPHPTLF